MGEGARKYSVTATILFWGRREGRRAERLNEVAFNSKFRNYNPEERKRIKDASGRH